MTSFCEGSRGGLRLHLDSAHPPIPISGAEPTIYVVGASPDLTSAVASFGIRSRTFNRGQEFLAAQPSLPGCLVCEVELPDISGFDVQDQLRQRGLRLPIVLVSAHARVADAVRAMRNGAVTFLRSPCVDEEIRSAIAEALDLMRRSGGRDVVQRTAAERFAALAAEDAAVLGLLLDGLPNKAVALRLELGLRTVERRRAAALRTLGVDSIVAAALLRSEAGAKAPTGGRIAV